MKTKFLLFLILTICLSCQNSSQISGQVYDENDQVLPQVKVQVIGTDIYTFTDDKGFFELDHKKRGDELLLLKSGYEMIFHDIKSDEKDLKFYLKPE